LANKGNQGRKAGGADRDRTGDLLTASRNRTLILSKALGKNQTVRNFGKNEPHLV
jgi:hypothetical protein